jgi:hypothetical protein
MKIIINENKSKITIFNKSRNFDFPLELSFKNGDLLECLGETKLLGIQVQSSLKWNPNTSAMYTKAMSKMWLLRRMKVLKLEPTLIFGLLHERDKASSRTRCYSVELWAD